MHSVRVFWFRSLAAALTAVAGFSSASATPPPVPTLVATKVADSPATKKNLGDEIAYTITVENTGTAAAGNVVLRDAAPANTADVAGSLRVTPIAFDDAYTIVGNTQTVVAASAGVLANDIDPDDVGAFANNHLSVKTGSLTRVAGGTTTGALTLNADGSFTYTPDVGATSSATERFSYVVTDRDQQDSESVGYIDFTISGRVWYVKNGGTGDGRSHSPLGSPATASTSATLATDVIYVYYDSGALNGAFSLADGQKLIGEGVPLVVNSTPLRAAGSAPTLTNTGGSIVTIKGLNTAGGTNTISGVILGNRAAAGWAIIGPTPNSNLGTLTVTSDVAISGTGQALNLSNGTLAATFASVSASGDNNGIILSGIAGSLTINGGALATLFGADFSVTGGNATISYAGTITNTSGRAVNISSMAGGSVTFSGAITDTGGTGVSLSNNNASTTITFSSGSLQLSTSGDTFTATGGGSVVVTGANNTLSSTGGTALNVSNTSSIGAGGLTFKSISAGSASNTGGSGILVNASGSTGGLTVTGTGSTAASGGTIQHKTGGDGTASGVGIYLNGISNVSLANLQLNDFGNFAIYGAGVSGLTLTNVKTSGVNGDNFATPFNEGSVSFDGLTGTVNFTNCDIRGGLQRNIRIVNSSGTANLTIAGCTIRDTSTGIGGDDNLYIEANTTATITAHVTNNTFKNSYGDHLQTAALDNSNLTIVFTGNSFSTADAGWTAGLLGGGVTIGGGATNSTEHVSFNISNNGTVGTPLTGTVGGGTLNIDKGAGSGVWQGAVSGNVIGSSSVAGSGGSQSGCIRVENHGNGSLTANVLNNALNSWDSGPAINFQVGDTGNANGALDLTVTGNAIANPGPNSQHGIVGNFGADLNGTNAVALELSNNTINLGATPPNAGSAIRLRQRNGSTVRLPGYAGSSTDTATVIAFVSGKNTLTPSGSVTATAQSPGGGFVGGAAPASPTIPSLMLALGGIDAVTPVIVSTAMNALEDAAFAPAAAASIAPTPSARATPLALSQADLDGAVAVAIARWAATGLSDEQVTRLHALRFEVANLSGLRLGEAEGSHIRIDRAAGGRGWFTGAESNALYRSTATATRLLTNATSAPAGRIDLLTAILHEMGHVLGLADTYAAADRDSIMYGWLSTGERRLPALHQAEYAQPDVSGVTHFLSAPLVIGTLPAGKKVKVTFRVAITARANVSNIATISATSLSDVITSAATTEVEQPPVVSGFSKSGTEDTTLTFAATDFTGNNHFTDPNSADSLVSVKITSLPAHGTLKLGVANIALNVPIPLASLGTITYVPVADYNGSDSFNWNASDGTLFATSDATASLSIAAVADTPAITAATTTEDTQSTTGLVISRSGADGAEVTHFKITHFKNGTLYKNNGTTQILDGDFITYAEGQAGLKFTPAADKNSPASDLFAFDVQGATDAIGTGLSSAAVVAITVTAVNDVPVPADDTLSAIDEDSGQRTIPFSALVANDSTGPANESAQTLVVASVANPVGGTVTTSGTDVLFTPAADFNGAASFTYKIADNGTTGGSADPQTSTASATVSFTINAVNDAPVITAPTTLSGTPNVAVTITGVSFADDSGANPVVVTFSSSGGSTAATSGGNVTVGGTAAARTLTGTIADLNTFLGGGAVTFTAAANTTLAVAINDQGNTGTGGAKTDSKNIAISLAQAPVVTTSGGATAASERTTTAVDPGLTVTDVDSTTLDHATASITANFASSEDSLAFANNNATTYGNISASYNSSTGVLTLTSSGASATLAQWQAALRAVTYTDSSHAPSTATRTITFSANDGGLDSAAATKLVSVSAVNEAPTLTTVSTLTGATEDLPFMIAYAALAAAADEADVDGDALAFRVETVSSGTLTKNGVPVVPGTTLLGTGESLVWTPAANANGTLDAFTVKASDGSLLSATAIQVQVTTAAVNDAPTLTTVTTLTGATEDTPFTITYATLAAAADEADIDGDALAFRVETVSSGTLTKNGNPVVPGTTLLGTGESLVWTPAANANGTLNAFTIEASDGSLLSATAIQVQVTTAAVNDAPTLTTVTALTGATEDTAFTISYATLAAAADEADIDGDALAFRVETVSSGTLTKNGNPVVPGTTLLGIGESLVWTPAANANGTLNAFTIEASDGSLLSATAIQVQVTTAAVNDAPTLSTVTTLTGATEDTAFTISYATLAAATDAADVDGDAISFRIEALSSGTLTKNNVAIAAGTTTLGTGESLVWTPAANANGTLNAFTIKATDATAFSATAVQVKVAVSAVNDAPTLTSAATLTGAIEDTAFTIAYATLAAATDAADVDGDAMAFRIEALSSGTLTKNNVAIAAGTTLLSTGESLVWTPAANANGTLNAFTLVAHDGTVSSATPVQVTVAVTSVNDAPVLAIAPASRTYTENSAALALVGGGSSLADVDNSTLAGATVVLSGGFAGDGESLSGTSTTNITATWNASTKTLTFSGSDSKTNYGTALASVKFVSTSDDPTNGGANLSRTVAWQLDDGQSVNNLSTPVTTTIAIAAVNDAPTIAGAVAGQTVTDKSSLAPFSAVTLADVDSASLTVTIVLDVAAKGTLTNLGGGAYDAGTGRYSLTGTGAALTTAVRALVFTPTANRVASATTETTAFTIALADSSFFAVANTTTTVVTTAVNDTPTDLALSAAAVTQASANNIVVGTLTTNDADPGDTFTYTLVTGAGSTDNASFNISGDKLRATAPSSLAPRDYSVRIRTTDGSNVTFEKTFTITVTDNVAPTIATVSGPAAGTYGIGTTLDFTVTFSEPVTVDTTGGTPTLALTLAGDPANATYLDGSGTTALLFRYIVKAGDHAADGEVILGALALNGGTIRDASVNDAILLFPPPAQPGVLVEARFHSADTNRDWALSLGELLRVIELYNTKSGTERTGAYRTAVNVTEDGYAAGPGAIAGSYHSADSNRDGAIGLAELLRVIELYNTKDGTTRTGAYHRSPGTEDGFESGPEPVVIIDKS